MLISKFDLYKGEWLELVFKNRNHQYGAYELRQTHNDLMTRTLAGVFLAAAVFGTTVTVIAHSRPIVDKPVKPHVTIVKLDPDKIFDAKPKEELKKAKPKADPPAAAPKTPQIKIQEYKQMVVTTDDKVLDEPKPLEAGVAIGPVEIKEGAKGENAPVSGLGNKTDGDGPGVDNGPAEAVVFAEFMPEPVGGMEAWAKFLQKNVRYPNVAAANGVSGKSYLSFVVEKDGSITDITILRKGGNGFDEEAMRVLRLAKPWKPGQQNGKPVRVRYTLPFNFQLEETN